MNVSTFSNWLKIIGKKILQPALDILQLVVGSHSLITFAPHFYPRACTRRSDWIDERERNEKFLLRCFDNNWFFFSSSSAESCKRLKTFYLIDSQASCCRVSFVAFVLSWKLSNFAIPSIYDTNLTLERQSNHRSLSNAHSTANWFSGVVEEDGRKVDNFSSRLHWTFHFSSSSPQKQHHQQYQRAQVTEERESYPLWMLRTRNVHCNQTIRIDSCVWEGKKSERTWEIVDH